MNIAHRGSRRLGIKVTLVLILVASLVVFMAIGEALAQCGPTPDPCGASKLFADPSRDKLYVHQGELITYWVEAGNRVGGPYPIPWGCDVANTTVTFHQPAYDGTPTGNSSVLETLVYFPSDESNNKVYFATSHAILYYTVNVDPSVTTITATATAQGVLMDGSCSNAQSDKDIGATVLWPDLEITKTGDEVSKVGDTINYEFFIENTGNETLDRVSVIDDVIGDITNDFPATLAAGANDTIYKSYTVQPGDDGDSLENTVVAI
ncbi:MAG: hypothetical protein SVO26_02490, partial [Chloroflexota bacterium]|nr:hypothetical protein [Chloroflexota bacterium]